MDFANALGLNKVPESQQEEREKLQLYINLKLASSGQPTCVPEKAEHFFGISRDLLRSYREKNRLLASHQYPVDRRIQAFIDRYLEELSLPQTPKLPGQTFVLDRHGVARELSLPLGKDSFHSDIVSSYRVAQGVLHNPASDRRTTKGSFHVTEGGLPIPGDKKAVPKLTNQGVPRLIDLVKTEKEKSMVQFLYSFMLIGRAVLAPPGAPQARVAALSAAFDRTMKDPAMKADLAKRKMPLNPTTGAELKAFISKLNATPEAQLAEIRASRVFCAPRPIIPSSLSRNRTV